MKYKALILDSEHIAFVDHVFRQNLEILHGGHISFDEWYSCLCIEPDPHEKNFIITADGENSAWLKLNGLNSSDIWISMLVVAKVFQRMGIGSFCVQFAEKFARNEFKKSIRIHTTKDNIAATKLYLRNDYKIEKDIRYTVGDGIIRDGYQFIKELEV